MEVYLYGEVEGNVDSLDFGIVIDGTLHYIAYEMIGDNEDRIHSIHRFKCRVNETCLLDSFNKIEKVRI